MDRKQAEKLAANLCRHLSSGYSLESYGPLSKAGIKTLQQAYPDILPDSRLEAAARAGRQTWEHIGLQQATGASLGNSRAWSFTMACRYGWTPTVRTESEASHTVQVVRYSPNTSTGG